MDELDRKFSVAPALPPAAALAAPWTAACVQSVLCPWSRRTVDVLRAGITLKSFDRLYFADEKWDGTAWVSARFPAAGYQKDTESGVINSNCEKMSETLYHEVLHVEEPKTHGTTLEKEEYAYRIGEEFSFAMGLGGGGGIGGRGGGRSNGGSALGPDLRTGGARPSVPTDSIRLTSHDTPTTLGRQIGQAVHGGLTR